MIYTSHNIKVIGGVQLVKNTCWAYFKIYIPTIKALFTEFKNLYPFSRYLSSKLGGQEQSIYIYIFPIKNMPKIEQKYQIVSIILSRLSRLSPNMFISIRFTKFKYFQVVSTVIFQNILTFLVILGQIYPFFIKMHFLERLKILSSFSKIMLSISNLDSVVHRRICQMATNTDF